MAGRRTCRRIFRSRGCPQGRPGEDRWIRIGRALRKPDHTGQVSVPVVLARRRGGSQMAQSNGASNGADKRARRGVRRLPAACGIGDARLWNERARRRAGGQPQDAWVTCGRRPVDRTDEKKRSPQRTQRKARGDKEPSRVKYLPSEVISAPDRPFTRTCFSSFLVFLRVLRVLCG